MHYKEDLQSFTRIIKAHDFRKLLFGAGIAAKLSATLFKVSSILLNLTDVVDVTNMKSPLPTIDADM